MGHEAVLEEQKTLHIAIHTWPRSHLEVREGNDMYDGAYHPADGI